MSVEEDSYDDQAMLEEELGIENEEPGEGEDVPGDDEEDAVGVSAGVYNPVEVNDQIFEELHLDPMVAQAVQECWKSFINMAESRDAVGEAIYAALFDAAPSLQGLFKTPRAVMAIRIMNGLNLIICSLHDPKGLKVIVETLGFQHLDLEVTSPRVGVFREAIVELLQDEMGTRFTKLTRDGFATFLNYVGGAYIYIRVKYAERLNCLAKSWALANNKAMALVDGEEGAEGEGGELASAEKGGNSGTSPQETPDKSKSKKKGSSWFGASSKGNSGGHGDGGATGEMGGTKNFQNTSVPKNFNDMFMFNAAVMGFGGSSWMTEVLASFDAIVLNAANSYRLQEECDVLSLRLAKFREAITLGQYKSVMLASLRSLVKDWGSLHEVSWSWLWENVERILQALIGKPAQNEAALAAFLSSLDESSLMMVRREVYAKFFALAPAGQDFFKQSTTRLHFIADKVVSMTIDMYREPKKMVEDLSALGLRHVGYGIPTDMFGPFVTACVQVIRLLTEDDRAEEAFRWSLSLVSRILTRVINEGSTIVMKAINANSGKQLRKAVACAPRGKRALWMLNVQVGTQSISPLVWAIETGSLDAARAIIVDLLTIRADRDRYYYGMDTLFERHHDIVKRLCLDAPALLPILLDGLIWRSRVTESGQRRVNYYIKHFVVDANGDFSPAIEWITDSRDAEIVCHPVVAMVTDIVWTRVAFRSFLVGKTWFLFTLLIFVLSQSILKHVEHDAFDNLHGLEERRRLEALVDTNSSEPVPGTDEHKEVTEYRIAIFILRVFIYVCSLGQGIFYHMKLTVKDCRARDFVKIGCLKLPMHLTNWQDAASLILMTFLVLMLCLEPILHCMGQSDMIFTQSCPVGDKLLFAYSVMTTIAMLFYFLLLSDLSVFSTRVSAFVLVCGRVVSEVLLFLFGLTFFVAAFACAISSLEQENPDFDGLPLSAFNLYRVTFQMFSGDRYDTVAESPALMVAIFVFVITSVIFLTNLLIAQLNCAYQACYQNMVGFARLNRGKIVHETMVNVSKKRWARFLENLRLDDRVEFGEGDIGLAGGVQVFEPASANITTKDMIRRFGGSTSPAAQWPEEEGHGDDEDRFDRIERLVERAMKRMGGKHKPAKGSAAGSSVLGTSSSAGEDASQEESSQG